MPLSDAQHANVLDGLQSGRWPAPTSQTGKLLNNLRNRGRKGKPEQVLIDALGRRGLIIYFDYDAERWKLPTVSDELSHAQHANVLDGSGRWPESTSQTGKLLNNLRNMGRKGKPEQVLIDALGRRGLIIYFDYDAERWKLPRSGGQAAPDAVQAVPDPTHDPGYATPQGGMPPNSDQQFFPGSDIRALNYSQADPYIPGNPMGDVDMAYPPYANTQGGMTPNAGGELFAGLRDEDLHALGCDPANLALSRSGLSKA